MWLLPSDRDPLVVRLPPGRYLVPWYYDASECERLATLLCDALPELRYTVVLPPSALPLGPEHALASPDQTLVLIRFEEDPGDELPQRLQGLAACMVLVQLPTPRETGYGWIERYVKPKLVSWLRNLVCAPDYPLAVFGVGELPVHEAATLSSEPVELIDLLEATLAHRLHFVHDRALTGRDYRRSLMLSAGRRLSVRLSELDGGEYQSALEVLLSEGDARQRSDRRDRRQGALALQRIGLARILGDDIVLGPLARHVRTREILGALALGASRRQFPTYPWDTWWAAWRSLAVRVPLGLVTTPIFRASPSVASDLLASVDRWLGSWAEHESIAAGRDVLSDLSTWPPGAAPLEDAVPGGLPASLLQLQREEQRSSEPERFGVLRELILLWGARGPGRLSTQNAALRELERRAPQEIYEHAALVHAEALACFARSSQDLEQARELVQGIVERIPEHSPLIVVARSVSAWVDIRRGDLVGGELVLRDVLGRFEMVDRPRGRAAVVANLAELLHRRGELGEALRLYTEEVLPAFECEGTEAYAAVVQERIARITAAHGAPEGALRLYDKHGLLDQALRADILSEKGELGEALWIYRDRGLAGELAVFVSGERYRSATGYSVVARLMSMLGQTDEAIALYRDEVLSTLDSYGAMYESSTIRLDLALLLLERGSDADRDVARGLLSETRAHVGSLSERGKARLEDLERDLWVPSEEAQEVVSAEDLTRYLAKLDSLHHTTPLIGLGATEVTTLPRGESHLMDRDIEANSKDVWFEKIALADAFGRARRVAKRGVLLLGDPGSGKTTELRRLVLDVVRDGPESIGLPPGTVPVFLPLRDFRGGSEGLVDFVEQALADQAVGMGLDFARRVVQRGRLLLIFDGVDEIADGARRAEVVRSIEALLGSMPDCFLIVSSSFSGHPQHHPEDASYLEFRVRPLGFEGARNLARGWYAIAEGVADQDPEAVALAAEGHSRALLDTLSGSKVRGWVSFVWMTRNPLLLTLMCLVHRSRGQLPRTRERLYEQSIEVLLERCIERSSGGLGVAEIRGALQLVAWELHDAGRTRVSAVELRALVSTALPSREDEDTDELLRTFGDESGLLARRGDEFGFVHLGFQEYLAAREIRNRELVEPGPFRALAQRFDDSWWQEVIRLVVAQDEPPLFDRFMREVVARPEFSEWAGSQMMELCLREAAGASVKPFVELLRAPSVAANAGQQLAAAKVLARSMPETLEGLAELLDEHPAEVVRKWWRAREDQKGRWSSDIETVLATYGGVELVLIPGGTFWMGSLKDEGRFGDEGPQHEVTLSSFYLARTPVTNAQYAEYMKANPGVQEPEEWGNQEFNQAEQPVVGVSWDEAKAYCDWAGLQLPTEAQWEYACRAGTTTRFHSGDGEEDLGRVGWYGGNSGGLLHAVAEKEPNGFGLCDMHGNVWEWCLDSWCVGYEGAVHQPVDGLRIQPVGDSDRVMRGGGFGSLADRARSAYRFRWHPGVRLGFLGFRPAQGLR